MFYGPEIWDPVLIVNQIAIMQSSFYLLTGLWLVLLQTLMGSRSEPALDQLLSAETMDFDQPLSSVPILAVLLGAPLCAVICSVVVDRAWQCLDFSATTHFLHLVACSFYGGFPLYWEWWAANLLSMIVMVLLSEYWLVKKEQEPIEMDEIGKV
mmetsp:Transcript_26954/g.65464  ORF Transcript_26954/g.65464 Transcript_26954/m.65464 type:complete len:154 (+) Transcript_26954:352-813(+)